MKLDLLCNVISGQIISRLKTKSGETPSDIRSARILMPKAIRDGGVIHDDLDVAQISKDPSPNFLTKEGDIIFKLSSPYGAAYIDKTEEGLLVPSFCCRLTEIRDVDPFFLLAYLNSKAAMHQYEVACGGSVVAILKINSVRTLEIPELPSAMQAEIGKRYRSILELRYLVENVFSLEKERFEVLFKETVEC